MLDHLESGQLDEAKRSFNLALRHDDDDMLFSLAEELYGLGFIRQAQRTYLKLLDRYPDEDQLRTALADIAIDEDNTDEALSYLSQIQPDSDAYLESLLVAADLYQTQELFEVSESKLKEAYQIAPEEPAVLFALGEFYFMMKQFDDAIAYYFELIKSGQAIFAQVDIAGRLAMSYAQSGQFEQALGYFEQVKPEFKSSDIAFQTGLTQLELKKYDDAIETLQELQSDDPQYASVYPALARAQEAQNDYESSLLTLQEGLGVDKYNEQLYKQAADAASHLGEEDLMQQYLEEGHEIDPDNLEITLAYSNLLLKQGKHPANIELLSPYVQNDEVDPQIYWNLAVSYQNTDDFDLAGKYYDAARPFFNDQADFLKQSFFFYREDGEHELSQSQLRRYLELVPSDSDLAMMLDE